MSSTTQQEMDVWAAPLLSCCSIVAGCAGALPQVAPAGCFLATSGEGRRLSGLDTLCAPSFGIRHRRAGCFLRGLGLQRFGQCTDVGLPDAREAARMAQHIVVPMVDGAAQGLDAEGVVAAAAPLGGFRTLARA